MRKSGIIIALVLLLAILFGVLSYSNWGDDDFSPPDVGPSFTLTIENMHRSVALSPGVYIVHTSEFSLNYKDTLSPEAFALLPEIGDTETFALYARRQRGVQNAIVIDESIPPGGKTTTTITLESGDRLEQLFLSGVHGLVATNDGYAAIAGLSFSRVVDSEEGYTVEGENFDNGTEDNEDLLSGFAGGQFDATRGDENIENGTPTDPQEEVSPHDQVFDTVLKVMLTPR